MCGFVGVLALDERGRAHHERLPSALERLRHRGPDNQGIHADGKLVLGHARLSVIDPSPRANQPMQACGGRYTIVYNGTFYNFREHRERLRREGVRFVTESDTEVLLHLYIREGPACLSEVNGSFAFALYDREEDALFIARDRFGIKPLLIYQGDDALIFASEMRSLLAFHIPRRLDPVSLFTYLQLSYIPSPHTILKDVRRLPAGHLLLVKNAGSGRPAVSEETYYSIPLSSEQAAEVSTRSYEEACRRLVSLLGEAVERRMVADVPLGCFLSGGVDSSIVTALAASTGDHLRTFSVGFKDDPFLDETRYARLVAERLKTDHTVLSITLDELCESLQRALDEIDEPFADSSSLVVSILSKHTREHVTVALSGDGGDELFAGYNKHRAELRARHPGLAEALLGKFSSFFRALRGSRSTRLGNLARQLSRFGLGLELPPKERYWRWASLAGEEDALSQLSASFLEEASLLPLSRGDYVKRKDWILRGIGARGDLDDILWTDMQLVLPDDMLKKVDSMSMAHSLEVRTPFLDHQVAEFAFTLPEDSKVSVSMGKRILRDAFRSHVPEEIRRREKRGFEVPLQRILCTDLGMRIQADLLHSELIAGQGIFRPDAVQRLRKRLLTRNPGDAAAMLWALLVFQSWWRRYIHS